MSPVITIKLKFEIPQGVRNKDGSYHDDYTQFTGKDPVWIYTNNADIEFDLGVLQGVAFNFMGMKRFLRNNDMITRTEILDDVVRKRWQCYKFLLANGIISINSIVKRKFSVASVAQSYGIQVGSNGLLDDTRIILPVLCDSLVDNKTYEEGTKLQGLKMEWCLDDTDCVAKCFVFIGFLDVGEGTMTKNDVIDAQGEQQGEPPTKKKKVVWVKQMLFVNGQTHAFIPLQYDPKDGNEIWQGGKITLYFRNKRKQEGVSGDDYGYVEPVMKCAYDYNSDVKQVHELPDIIKERYSNNNAPYFDSANTLLDTAEELGHFHAGLEMHKGHLEVGNKYLSSHHKIGQISIIKGESFKHHGSSEHMKNYKDYRDLSIDLFVNTVAINGNVFT